MTVPFRPRSRRDDVFGATMTVIIELAIVAGLFFLATALAGLVLLLIP